MFFVISDDTITRDKSKDEVIERMLLNLGNEKLSEDKRIWALEELYNLTRASVYGYALTTVKNPTDAEDILQDTYIQLYKGAKFYKAQGKPMAYIITVAKNLCMMKYRQSQKTVDVSEEEFVNFVAESRELSTEDKIVLETYLGKLSEEEREIVILFAVADFKHREIAEMLDMPMSTVMSKYNRAIQKLKKIASAEN